ncbi:MAG TPA: serine/threonine-protein kinase, partial [Minicystis sp.]|nr:serine/threonine-protein kinase [Minicystis sp.]
MRRCPSCGERFPVDFVVCPKDGTTLANTDAGDDPLVGEVLGGTFCIRRLLGEGGMGRVYEAEHVRLPKRFAIKVMREDLVRHPDALARFEREAHAVARVVHDHVVEVVDLIRSKDGRPCIVTELLEGRELGDLLKQEGRLPLGTSIAIARQVCRAVGAAHAAGIVHRDLKPSNLFLLKRSDGRTFVKVLDFGVAKLSDGTDLTRTGMVVGTPAYMAPEQALGIKEVDERVDVYSIGAVLYHMLTGSAPFVGDEAAVVLTRVLTEDPRRPRDLNRSIPDAVEDLVQRAMARAPEDRTRSVLDLERELGAVDPDEAAGAGEAPSSARAARDARFEQPGSRDAPAPSGTSRWRRSGAMGMVLVWSAFSFAAMLATAAAGLRLYGGRGAVGDTELLLLCVVSGVATTLVLASGGRALFA